MRVRGCIAVLALLVLAGTASDVQAQATGQTMLVPIQNRSYIGFNPLGIPFDIFTVEGETGVAPGITVGGVASNISVDHDRYTSFDFKVRYYPGEIVLRGFSLGATLGYMNYKNTDCCTNPGGVQISNSLGTPTIGIITDYNWMLGAEHRFVVGTGLGAKRVLASSADRDRVGLDRAFLTARFTVGLAF